MGDTIKRGGDEAAELALEMGSGFAHAAHRQAGQVAPYSYGKAEDLSATVREALNRSVEYGTELTLRLQPGTTRKRSAARADTAVALLVSDYAAAAAASLLDQQSDDRRIDVRLLPVRERVEADGSLGFQPDIVDLSEVASTLKTWDVKTVGIVFIHSLENPINETFVSDYLEKRGFTVFMSCDQSNWGDEAARVSTTVRSIDHHCCELTEISELAATLKKTEVGLQTTYGGTMPVEYCLEHPLDAVADPASAAAEYAGWLCDKLGMENVVTLEMGASHTAVVNWQDGIRIYDSIDDALADSKLIPSAAIERIAIGGHSVMGRCENGLHTLRLDGEYQPACYGQGNEVTLTDAFLYLGYIPDSALLAGAITPDLQNCNRALEELAEADSINPLELAEQMIELAEAELEGAYLRLMAGSGGEGSGNRLCAFGGHSGLHACRLAEAVNIDSVIIPWEAGSLAAQAALGSGAAISRNVRLREPTEELEGDAVQDALGRCRDLAVNEMISCGHHEDELLTERSLYLRSHGNTTVLQIPYGKELKESFRQAWKQYCQVDAPATGVCCEGVSVVVRTLSQREAPTRYQKARRIPEGNEIGIIHNKRQHAARLYQRSTLQHGMEFSGPAIVRAQDHIVYVGEPWRCSVDGFLNLVMRRR